MPSRTSHMCAFPAWKCATRKALRRLGPWLRNSPRCCGACARSITSSSTLRRELRLDAVISDQRFGIRAEGLPSVIITHQLFPFTPFAQGVLRRINLRSVARFDRCWVPDDASAPGLAGDLSHGRNVPHNARYIGPVSRMDPAKAIAPKAPYRIVCVISGPEPQRTLLEEALMKQLPRIKGHHLLVRGKPEPALDETIVTPDGAPGIVHRVSHLGGDALTGALLQAELIVSRTGYTTLMDLVRIGRSALVVPTPGQAEQEYLGQLHAKTGRFLMQAQERLDIADAIEGGRFAEPRVAQDWRSGIVPDTGTPSDAHHLLEHALQDLAVIITMSRR